MIEVTDHFLDRESYRKIADFLLSSDKCDWKYNHEKVSSSKDELNNYQFIHLFYSCHSVTGKGQHKISKHIDILTPLINKMRFIALHRIKANLEPIKSERYHSKFHYDLAVQDKPCPSMTTAIYYINTNDGYTEFETGEKVRSVANRYVKFPSNIKHRGVSQLDTKVRCVLNCNYFEF